jgi:hypothetical protein
VLLLLLMMMLLLPIISLAGACVRNHLADQLTQPPLKFASSRATTFACVDAREDGAELVRYVTFLLF